MPAASPSAEPIRRSAVVDPADAARPYMKSTISEPSRTTATAQTTPRATIERLPVRTASPTCFTCAASSRPWLAIQTLCQTSMTTATMRIEALKISCPIPASALAIAPANAATRQAPTTPAAMPAAMTSLLPCTPCVTASTMPTMRPASMISRKTMINAPSIASLSAPFPCVSLHHQKPFRRGFVIVVEEAIATGLQRTQVDGDGPAADDHFFDPEHLALEFRRRSVLVDDLEDDRLAGGGLRLGRREFVVLERDGHFGRLVGVGCGREPERQRKARAEQATGKDHHELRARPSEADRRRGPQPPMFDNKRAAVEQAQPVQFRSNSNRGAPLTPRRLEGIARRHGPKKLRLEANK